MLVSVPSQNYSIVCTGKYLEKHRVIFNFFAEKVQELFRDVVKHIAQHACLSVKHSIPSKSGLIHETMSETISIEFIV